MRRRLDLSRLRKGLELSIGSRVNDIYPRICGRTGLGVDHADGHLARCAYRGHVQRPRGGLTGDGDLLARLLLTSGDGNRQAPIGDRARIGRGGDLQFHAITRADHHVTRRDRQLAAGQADGGEHRAIEDRLSARAVKLHHEGNARDQRVAHRDLNRDLLPLVRQFDVVLRPLDDVLVIGVVAKLDGAQRKCAGSARMDRAAIVKADRCGEVAGVNCRFPLGAGSQLSGLCALKHRLGDHCVLTMPAGRLPPRAFLETRIRQHVVARCGKGRDADK